MELLTAKPNITVNWPIIKEIVQNLGEISPEIAKKILHSATKAYPLDKNILLDINEVIITNELTDLSQITEDVLVALRHLANFNENSISRNIISQEDDRNALSVRSVSTLNAQNGLNFSAHEKPFDYMDSSLHMARLPVSVSTRCFIKPADHEETVSTSVQPVPVFRSDIVDRPIIFEPPVSEESNEVRSTEQPQNNLSENESFPRISNNRRRSSQKNSSSERRNFESSSFRTTSSYDSAESSDSDERNIGLPVHMIYRTMNNFYSSIPTSSNSSHTSSVSSENQYMSQHIPQHIIPDIP